MSEQCTFTPKISNSNRNHKISAKQSTVFYNKNLNWSNNVVQKTQSKIEISKLSEELNKDYVNKLFLIDKFIENGLEYHSVYIIDQNSKKIYQNLIE